jgi:hypothetical protein
LWFACWNECSDGIRGVSDVLCVCMVAVLNLIRLEDDNGQ